MATKKATTSTKKTVSRATAVRKTTVAGHIQSSISSIPLWRSLSAEAIGTFLLAGIIIAGQGQPIFVLFGLVGIVLLIGTISGAHVNPAITIAAWATRRIGWLRTVGYIFAQIAGALLAYATLNAFIGGAAPVSEEAALYGQTAATLYQAVDVNALTGKEWYVFFAELLGTAILGFAIASSLRQAKDRTASAFTAGLGIFIALMIAVSAASYVGANAILNPAVALSLQAFTWDTWPIAIYAVAPIIGATVGFVAHRFLTGRSN